MKKSEIVVGGKYLAKVSGVITTVRVDAIREANRLDRDVVVYDVTNLHTGRKTTFRSAAKFRASASVSQKAVSQKGLDPRNKCSKCGQQLVGPYPGGFEPVVCYTCKTSQPTKATSEPLTPRGRGGRRPYGAPNHG